MKSQKHSLLAGIRGVERKEALSRGGQQAIVYRSAGVKATRSVDQKKRAARRACRGRVQR